MRGYSNQEIAKELDMAIRTVKAHFNRMYVLFGIDNRYYKRVRLIYLLFEQHRRKLKEHR